MSYIELINAAWELREQGIITVHEHDLYSYLLHRCNKLNWKNPFNQSTEIICATLGMNRNALMIRRNKLKRAGLITFKEGTAKSKPAEYCIKSILKDTPSDTLSYTHSDTLTNTLTDTYTKDKTKQDKTREKEKIEKEIFEKPSVPLVEEYCRLRNNRIDAHMFVDFYEAKDWMIGKSLMKDWRSAVRTWERNQRKNSHNTANHDNTKSYEMF